MRALIGCLLLFFGLSYLGAEFSWWQAVPWTIIFHFWPVLLIFLGLSMVVTDRVWLVVAALALLISLAALYVFRPDVADRFRHVPTSWGWDQSSSNTDQSWPSWMRQMMPGWPDSDQSQ